MKNIYVILISAIIGWLLFDWVILIDNRSSDTGMTQGLGWILAMPSAWVDSTFDLRHDSNPYIVNGLLGAVVLVLIVLSWNAFWKFITRRKK